MEGGSVADFFLQSVYTFLHCDKLQFIGPLGLLQVMTLVSEAFCASVLLVYLRFYVRNELLYSLLNEVSFPDHLTSDYLRIKQRNMKFLVLREYKRLVLLLGFAVQPLTDSFH